MAATAMLAALVIGTVTYVGLRLRATYEIRTEMGLLNQKFNLVMADAESLHIHIEERLDAIEKFLFGDVLESLMTTKAQTPSAVPLPRPTVVQLWQQNRDKELRERLDALERHHLKDEQRIEQLEQMIRDIKREIR
jgi:hypothetical protein